MDELFIQIRQGQPYQHPIYGDNFRQAFPHVDVDNLPPEFARFKRIESPMNAGEFEVDVVTYQWVDNMVQDVWSVRPMTDEERSQEIQKRTNYVFDYVDFLKRLAQQGIEENEDPQRKAAWAEYKIKIDAWVFVDAFDPKIPQPPLFNADGSVMTLDASSEAPNVIA